MSKHKVLLLNVAEIKQGYQFREKIVENSDSSIRVVQMANIIDGKGIDFQSLVRTAKSGFKAEHYLKKGDILFCARGDNNYALLIQEDIQDIIAVSQFLIIRTKNTELLPAYLAWYLGQPEATAYFKAITLMSTVPLINKKPLANLKIPLPPMPKQKIIAEIYKLKEKEQELVKQIIYKKDKVINAVLLKSIKNEEPLNGRQ